MLLSTTVEFENKTLALSRSLLAVAKFQKGRAVDGWLGSPLAKEGAKLATDLPLIQRKDGHCWTKQVKLGAVEGWGMGSSWSETRAGRLAVSVDQSESKWAKAPEMSSTRRRWVRVVEHVRSAEANGGSGVTA